MSHEINSLMVIPYKTLSEMMPMNDILSFRKNALNPDHPCVRGSSQDPDIYFQMLERSNQYYLNVPNIVDNSLEQFKFFTGRDVFILFVLV